MNKKITLTIDPTKCLHCLMAEVLFAAQYATGQTIGVKAVLAHLANVQADVIGVAIERFGSDPMALMKDATSHLAAYTKITIDDMAMGKPPGPAGHN